MKKLSLMMISGFCMSMGFVSCVNHDIEPLSQQELVQNNYASAFVKTFGQPAANQDWGFGTAMKSVSMRSIIDEINDPFTKYDTKGFYLTEVPEGVPTAAEINNAFYNYVNDGDFKVELTEGEYEIGMWGVGLTYDFYITGKVTLKSNTIWGARLHVLPGGELTYTGNPIHNIEIFVSENGVLNYGLKDISSQGAYINGANTNTIAHIFNHGTVNLPENFEVNQDAVFYNEGTVKGVDITSKPGDGHPSYFYNYGDLTLSGKMELNSCSNFYNEGNVVVEGNTEFTQAGTWWINKGHYTTENMNFSAKNGCVYNYCQLLVEKNLHLYDGEFNLMDGSYTEANTAEFDNFVVNMGGNSGINIKNGTTFPVGQGDGTYQGFKATGDNAYVRLGGTTTVAEHKLTFELSGNITYAINNLVDEGADNSGVQPTYRFNKGTVEIPFGELSATPNEEDCGATWNVGGDKTGVKYRIIGEDLSASEATDFDFNDIVLDVEIKDGNANCTLIAAGGTLPLRIQENDALEVHKLFGVDTNVMVNTGIGEEISHRTFTLEGVTNPANIKIEVKKDGVWCELTAFTGQPAAKILVDQDCEPCAEREDIDVKYEGKFKQYVRKEIDKFWK